MIKLNELKQLLTKELQFEQNDIHSQLEYIESQLDLLDDGNSISVSESDLLESYDACHDRLTEITSELEKIDMLNYSDLQIYIQDN